MINLLGRVLCVHRKRSLRTQKVLPKRKSFTMTPKHMSYSEDLILSWPSHQPTRKGPWPTRMASAMWLEQYVAKWLKLCSQMPTGYDKTCQPRTSPPRISPLSSRFSPGRAWDSLTDGEEEKDCPTKEARLDHCCGREAGVISEEDGNCSYYIALHLC